MTAAGKERPTGRSRADRNDWFVAAFDRHYPLLYQHRDENEARRCLELLPRLAPLGAGPVLDLGCGGGRHLTVLAEQGWRAVGLDLSPALLAAAARRRAGAVRRFGLLRGDMRAIPLRRASTSAVLSLFTAFGYFGERTEHAAVVAEVARVLADGGHWFLDYFAADRVREELATGPSRLREREVAPLRIREVRRLETAPACVAKDVELTPLAGQEEEAGTFGVPPAGRRYTERVALFSLAELDVLAASAGLVRVAAAGGYDGQSLGAAGADRWILVYGHRRRPRPPEGRIRRRA